MLPAVSRYASPPPCYGSSQVCWSRGQESAFWSLRRASMRSVWTDIKYALRGLLRDPLFTVQWFSPLVPGSAPTSPSSVCSIRCSCSRYLSGNRSNWFQWHCAASKGGSWCPDDISYPIYEAFRDRNQVFLGMLCGYPLAVTMLTGNSSEHPDWMLRASLCPSPRCRKSRRQSKSPR